MSKSKTTWQSIHTFLNLVPYAKKTVKTKAVALIQIDGKHQSEEN